MMISHQLESWRKVSVEERASAKALWWKELGTAEDQKVMRQPKEEGREWNEVRGSRGQVCRVLRPGEECRL